MGDLQKVFAALRSLGWARQKARKLALGLSVWKPGSRPGFFWRNAQGWGSCEGHLVVKPWRAPFRHDNNNRICNNSNNDSKKDDSSNNNSRASV